MAIPDYQSLMLPVLKLAGDGNEHRISDVVDTLASQLKLTEAEREELLPKGKQLVFNGRVHWAKTYLAQAKLLIATRRAHFKITERGQSVLAENVKRIDAKFLRRYDEFNAFVGKGRLLNNFILHQARCIVRRATLLQNCSDRWRVAGALDDPSFGRRARCRDDALQDD